jgi:hypothetical protein
MNSILEQARRRAVLRVGDGRGFVVDLRNLYGHPRRCIITAAHCVPIPEQSQPPWEHTKPKFVGPLGAEPTIAVEILFWDPITDIAVLGEPDNQELAEECEAYEAFLKQAGRIPIAPLQLPLQAGDWERTSPVWMLSLEGEWFRCDIQDNVLMLSVSHAEKPIEGGMSGSPILDQSGAALGAVSTSHRIDGQDTREGYGARLAISLPPRLTCAQPLMKSRSRRPR